MTKFFDSLQVRLTAMFVVLLLLITALTYVYMYSEAKTALKETVRDELSEVAAMSSSYFKGETLNELLALKAGDENTPQYNRISNALYEMRKNSEELANFYIMKKEGDKIIFLVDDLFISEPEDSAKIYDEYTDYDESLLRGFEAPSSSKDFYTDEWGTFLSGYAPIKDADGKTVAVIGIDMKVTKVVQKQEFLSSRIYYILAGAILLAGIFIFSLSRTLSQDINKMTTVAGKISEGDLSVQLPEIRSKNEIYELNEGLKSVVAAVHFLKDHAEALEREKGTKPSAKPKPAKKQKKAKKKR